MSNRPYGLFNLHGIGFSKTGEKFEAPRVPEIIITADGNRLQVPAEPIYFTNFNGYTEANHYQVYGPLTDKSELKVESTMPGVEIKIGKIEDGRATVRCTYNGKEKVFHIN